jgi:hypothetical protein
MRKTTTALLVTAALVALACSAPDVTSNGAAAPAPDVTTAAPKAVKVGEALTVDTGPVAATWTVTKVEVKDGDQYDSAPQNGKFLLVHLAVSVTKGETYSCGCDLSVVDASGKVFQTGYGSFAGRPDYPVANVAAGQKTDGWVIFDVTADAAKSGKVQLKVQQLFADSAYGYWAL